MMIGGIDQKIEELLPDPVFVRFLRSLSLLRGLILSIGSKFPLSDLATE